MRRRVTGVAFACAVSGSAIISAAGGAAALPHIQNVRVLSVSPGPWLPSANIHGLPTEIPTVNVTIRLSGQPGSQYNCSVIVRRAAKIVGRTQEGPLHPGDVPLMVEVTTKKPFSGRPSEAKVRCS